MKGSSKKNSISPAPYGDAIFTYSDDVDSTAAVVTNRTQMYADEAELYSIAEDSREECDMSGVTPGAQVEAAAAAAMSTHVNQNNRTFLDDNDEEMFVSGEKEGVELTLDDEDDASQNWFYNYNQRRRRSIVMTTMFMICLLFSILVTYVGVTQSQKSSARNTASAEIVENKASSTAVPTATPISPAPTYADSTQQQAEALVVLAINACPGEKSFFNETTLQGRVFRQIVNEVKEKASWDPSTGKSTFDELHGIDYLQEKYALGMLYYTTNGESWDLNELWMDQSDPCDGWMGIECDSPRVKGTCAVTRLNLGKFSSHAVSPITNLCTKWNIHVLSSHSGLAQMQTICQATSLKNFAASLVFNIVAWPEMILGVTF